MDDDPHLTITDVRLAGYCVKGAQEWAEARGVDFRAFVKRGERASVLKAIDDDGVIQRIVEAKRKREDGGRR